jgi:hypothetical protein
MAISSTKDWWRCPKPRSPIFDWCLAPSRRYHDWHMRSLFCGVTRVWPIGPRCPFPPLIAKVRSISHWCLPSARRSTIPERRQSLASPQSPRRSERGAVRLNKFVRDHVVEWAGLIDGRRCLLPFPQRGAGRHRKASSLRARPHVQSASSASDRSSRFRLPRISVVIARTPHPFPASAASRVAPSVRDENVYMI